MKRTIVFLTMISVLAGLLVLPASSAPPWTPGNGNPAVPAQELGNSNDHPVFGDDWPPFPNRWPFNDAAMPGSDDAGNWDFPVRDPGSPGDGDGTNSTDNLGQIPGCQEGEVHIPEDQDCDGRIDARFGGPDDDVNSGTNGSAPDNPDDGSSGVTEERSVTPAPEPDGQGENWISYPNPRDHILSYDTLESTGDMKVCALLLNQAGEPINGDTVSDTTFSVDTNIGEQQPAYTEDTNPVTFTTPLNQVADLMGSDPSLPEGDGMLDSECAEFHNLPFGTYTYSQEQITGANADNVEFVGLTEYWDDANRGNPFQGNLYSYGQNDLSDGTVTLTPAEDSNHAEVVYVFRLR